MAQYVQVSLRGEKAEEMSREIDASRKLLMDMIADADRDGAMRLIEEWGSCHGYDKLLMDVLDPVLRAVGERWQVEEFSLAQSYVAAKIAEAALIKMEKSPANLPDHSVATEKRAILGNIEDDVHGLGRRMVATFLQVAGWDVLDLGIDVEPQAFIDAALDRGARIIGTSAMTYSTAENILHVRQLLEQRGLAGRIKLAVGGAVFVSRPELVQEVGGDGTAVSAAEAPALFDRLLKLAVQSGVER